uniref:Uncharacterized protein n=1 Tax=Haptolina brevifila TaxID=156173 RepID=A0A7S2BNF8_9EUKA|mmetsp:Transcript_14834/g.29831  ORF Transcript_14834/g.29831 Transcript_14834/m.29831 type:complete len:123 (+) Transcript_14834:1-369(+)
MEPDEEMEPDEDAIQADDIQADDAGVRPPPRSFTTSKPDQASGIGGRAIGGGRTIGGGAAVMALAVLLMALAIGFFFHYYSDHVSHQLSEHPIATGMPLSSDDANSEPPTAANEPTMDTPAV